MQENILQILTRRLNRDFFSQLEKKILYKLKTETLSSYRNAAHRTCADLRFSRDVKTAGLNALSFVSFLCGLDKEKKI